MPRSARRRAKPPAGLVAHREQGALGGHGAGAGGGGFRRRHAYVPAMRTTYIGLGGNLQAGPSRSRRSASWRGSRTPWSSVAPHQPASADATSGSWRPRSRHPRRVAVPRPTRCRPAHPVRWRTSAQDSERCAGCARSSACPSRKAERLERDAPPEGSRPGLYTSSSSPERKHGACESPRRRHPRHGPPARPALGERQDRLGGFARRLADLASNWSPRGDTGKALRDAG